MSTGRKALTVLLFLSVVTVWVRADGPVTVERVDRLIRQMSSRRFRVRKEAHEALKALGPEALPMLKKYRGHANPEIRNRIEAIIEANSWACRGSLVCRVVEDSDAWRAGLRAGDVIVKVNGEDHHPRDSIGSLNMTRALVWRNGQFVKLDFSEGNRLFWYCDWHLDKGGAEAALAMLALAREDYDAARPLFAKAIAGGLDPDYFRRERIGLAEWAMDHEAAMEIFEPWMALNKGRMSDFMRMPDASVHDVPWSAAYTAYLVQRYRKMRKDRGDALDMAVVHQLAGISAYSGHNLPLARELSALAWPEDLDRRERHGYDMLRVYLGHYDGREREVIRIARRHEPQSRLYRVGLFSATRVGDVDFLVDSARTYLTKGESLWSSEHYEAGPCAIAAARFTGRDVDAQSLLELLAAAPADERRKYLTNQMGRLLGHRALVEDVLETLGPALRGDRQLNATYLRLLAVRPGLTVDQWREAWRACKPRLKDKSTEARALRSVATGVLLRLGRLDDAADLLAGKHGKLGWREKKHLEAAHEFLSDESNAEKLKGPWRQLAGTIMVFKGRKCRWLCRWDGRCFRLIGEKIDEPPGLDPDMPFYPDCLETVSTHGGTTRLKRRFQLYVLDRESQRWIKTWLIRSEEQCRRWKLAGGNEGRFLRYYLKEYGPARPGRMLRTWGNCNPYVVFQVGNDVACAYHWGKGFFLDLGKKIGEMSGAGRNARISKVLHKTIGDAPIVVHSDLGLWTVDREGRMQRVDLGLRNPNQWVVAARYPKRKGKYYVGLLPQNGGTMFEIDAAGGKVTRTGGYIGHGPRGAYAGFAAFLRYWSDMQESGIIALYTPESTDQAEPPKTAGP